MINRRVFLRRIGLGAIGTVAASLGCGKNLVWGRESKDRPNVIIVLADDLGYGDLGCYGHPFIKTPNLDKFAAEGMKLTACYSAGPICSPARAGLLTGRCAYRVGVYHLAGGSTFLRDEERTIAELARGAGYATCFLGKWHLGQLDGRHPGPGEQGFDYWFATLANCFPRDPDQFLRNGKAVGKIEGWYCDIVMREAMDWVDKVGRDKPFFIEICTSEPHTPLSPPEKYTDMYRGEEVEKLEKEIEYGRVERYPHIEDVASQRRQYYGTVTQLDAAFGRLMEGLEQRGLADNTLVIFTSDNGPEIPGGSTGLDLSRNRAWGTPGKLRGMKRHLYEGGIRVPGIIRWPRGIRAGTVSDEAVGSVDFLPTVCELSGAKVPGDRVIDGVSIMPVFEGKKLERTRPLCWNINYTGVPNMAMRMGDEVLLGFADEPAKGQPLMEWIKSAKLVRFELYNLKSDITQRIDLARGRPQRLDLLIGRMKKLWRQLQVEGPTWPSGGRVKPAVGKVWAD